MAGWFSRRTAQHLDIIMLADVLGTGQNYFALTAIEGGAGVLGYAIASSTAAGSAQAITAQIADNPGAGEWHHACAVFTSASSRAAFIDGGNKATNSTSITPSGIVQTGIGASIIGSANGSLSDVAVWNVALTDAEVAALARGMSPLFVRPSGLIAYWPLDTTTAYLNRVRATTDRTLSLAVGAVAQATNGPPVSGDRYYFRPVGWRGAARWIPGLQPAVGVDAFWKAASDAATSDATGYTNEINKLVAVSLIQVSPAATLTATALAVASPAIGVGTLAQTQALSAPTLAAGAPALGAGSLGQRHALNASAGSAAPATAAFQKGVTTSGSGTSRTLPFTAIASAAGQERLVALVSITSQYATTTFSGVLVDGQTATQVGPYVRVYDGLDSNGPLVSFWRAPGTANTSINVTFNIAAGAVYDARGVLWTLNDAGLLYDFTATTGTSNVAVGNIDLDLSVDTVANGTAAAAIIAYNSVTRSTTWSGLTERWDNVNDAGLYGRDWYSAADLNVTSSSTPLTITADLPADFDYTSAAVGLAVSFSPSGVGGGPFAVGSPVIGTPAATVKVTLVASALAVSSPVLGTGTVGQSGVMAAAPLAAGVPVIGAPALKQAHAFLTLFEPQLSISPTVDLAFIRSPVGAAAITVTRNNAQSWAEDTLGNWTSFPANVPRITDKGLYIEPVITNQVFNSSWLGAVPGVIGSGGVAPSNWSIGTGTCTRTIVGIGVEANGVEYIDIRISGASGSTGALIIGSNSIASATGQPWSVSAWMKLVAGSVTAGLVPGGMVLRVSGEAGGLILDGGVLDGTWKRLTNSRVLATGTTAQWTLRFATVDAVTPIDFTIRIGWPQLENTAVVSAPVRTTSAAVAKQADNVTLVSPPSPIPASGGLFVEFALPRAAFAGQSGNFYLCQLSDGTSNNRALAYVSWTNATAPKRFTVSNAASAQGDISVNSTYAYNEAVSRIAGRFADNDMRAAVDGVLSGFDLACIMPTNFTLLEIGKVGGTSVGMWGYIRRVKYFNQPPTDNDLVLLTGGPGVSSPVIGQGSLGQKHVLVPVGIAVSSPVIDAGPIAETNHLAAVAVAVPAPVISTSTITKQGHTFLAPAYVNGSPVIAAGAFKQKQVLVATGTVAGHPVLGVAVFTQGGTCVAFPLTVGRPVFGVSGVKQVHNLAALRLSLSSGAVLGTPKAVIKAPPLFAVNLTVASPSISPLRPVLGFVNILAPAPDFHVSRPDFGFPDAELIAPPEVFFPVRETRWSRDPNAEFYDDDNSQFGAKVKQAIFTNKNDLIAMWMSSGTLAGRTDRERGLVQEIIVSLPLWLRDKKLGIDWSEVDQLRDDVNALMAAVTANSAALATNTAAIAANTAQVAVNTAALAVNTALLAGLKADLDKLQRQLKVYIPRDLVAGAPILGTPRAATRLPAATNLVVASPVLGNPVLVRVV
jgi:Concanavalin A-like lectin/glucanases superfamily